METVLALILLLRPATPPSNAQSVADAIYAASTDPHDVAELTMISLTETAFGTTSSIPFGITCCMRQHTTTRQAAAIALRVLRVSRRVCGENLASRMSFYVTGNCAVTSEGRRRARLVVRLTHRLETMAAESHAGVPGTPGDGMSQLPDSTSETEEIPGLGVR